MTMFLINSGNTIVQMYALNHPEFTAQAWHVFVVYVISVWLACAAVCLANSAMPVLNKAGIFLYVWPWPFKARFPCNTLQILIAKD